MPKGVAIACAAVGMSTALLIAFALITTTSQPAMANAAIAKKTGQACSKCHSAPPALNAYGKKYKEGKVVSTGRLRNPLHPDSLPGS